MAQLRWIKISLFLILVLQFTAVNAALSSFIVRDGDHVTLPCDNVIDNENKCDSTTWILSGSSHTAAVELVTHGKICENDQFKSDRLSVTENCSLVIKKVTVKDAGRYDCQQFKAGRQQGQDSLTVLSVVTITISPPSPVIEHKDTEKVTLSCSVSTHEWCRHTVKWLNKDKNVDEDKHMATSETGCSVTITKYEELFKCEVTDGYNQNVQLFTFIPQSSGEGTASVTTTLAMRTTESSKTTSTNITVTTSTPQGWLLYIVAAVGSAALIVVVTVVAVIRRKKAKGNKTEMDENVQSLNPVVTPPGPEISPNMADPDDGVSYSSISFIKKSDSKAQKQVKDDDEGEDEGDAVTYSTVKTSSVVVSTDPSSLYATINKPSK